MDDMLLKLDNLPESRAKLPMYHKIKITVNVAISLNGYISGPGGKRVVISDRVDLERVNDLRAKSDAILVGANTIVNDNPELKIHDSTNRKHARIVLDRKLKIPESSNVLDGTCRTMIFTSNAKRKLKGADLVIMNDDSLGIGNIMAKIEETGIGSLLVEGGSIVINEFISERIIDDFFIYIGNVILPEDGIKLFRPNIEIRNIIVERKNFGEGILLRIDPLKLVSNA